MTNLLNAMDRVFNPLYKALGYLAALFLLAIAVLVLISVVSRGLQIYIPGLNVYAGFCMAAATFCAMAYTFTGQNHIRVSIFIGAASPKVRYMLEVWCLVAASIIVSFCTYYFGKMAYLSFIFGEKSQDIDATPLWIPQLSLVIGMALLSIACLHKLLACVVGTSAQYQNLLEHPLD